MAPTVRVIASARGGDFAVSDGILYILTECCGASAKGTEHGVACRKCYRALPEIAGWTTLVDSEDAHDAIVWYLARAWRSTSPILSEVADTVLKGARA